MPARQRHYQRPVPSDSSDTDYLVPQPRPHSHASARQHPYPSSSGIVVQPGVSGTVPQTPAPSRREEVMHGLPSRNMGGKWKEELRTAGSLARTHVGFHVGLHFVCAEEENCSLTQLFIPVQQGYIITETCFCLFAFRHLQVWSTMIHEGFLYLPHTVCRRSGWQICTELVVNINLKIIQ